MESFTESEVQQSRQNVVLDLQKVPLQAFLSVPAESVSAIINVKVDGIQDELHGGARLHGAFCLEREDVLIRFPL
jgi:hypothetical protein